MTMTNTPPPLPFDTFTLAAVAAELRRHLLGARVQKIQQPSPHDLVIALYGSRGGAQRLLLSADPARFRVHLTQVKRENPITPPGFCQVCRKYLDGAVLDEVTMPRFDRVLHLVFRAHDNERLRLIAELMGRNANLVLVSGTGVVRSAIRPAPPTGARPLNPGAVYADPPGFDDRLDPLTSLDQADALPPQDQSAPPPQTYLTTAFSGIGRFAADEIAARAKNGVTVAAALGEVMSAVREERFAPHSIADAENNTVGVWALEPLTVPPGRRFPRESVSVALDTFYALIVERSAEDTEKTTLARALERETAYRKKELASARATLAEAGRAETYEQAGNNLLASLSLIERGAASATLPDLYAGEPDQTVTVTLDPKRSPQENAQGFFDRARKARDAAEYADGQGEDLTDELATLAALAADLERAESAEDFARVREALTEIVGEARVAGKSSQAAAASRPKAKPFDGHRIRTYTVDGYDLLVGETAEANDYLTTRVAAPSDYWFHVRAATGAHAVLRTQGKPERVPESVLRRAAAHVAARSGTSVKHTRLVAVDAVLKRYVRKPRGAKPGLVTYERERTLDVTPGLL